MLHAANKKKLGRQEVVLPHTKAIITSLVVAHVEPFHLQRSIWHWNVAGWEPFGDA